MARRSALLVSLLAPSLAFAQTITITESNDQDKIVNISECSGAVTDQLSFSFTASTSSLDLYASDQASCPQRSDSNTTVTTITVKAGIAAGTTSLSNAITVPSLLDQLAISCPGSKTTVYFCLFQGGTTTTTVATGNLTLDLQTPPAPVANAPTPGDSALNVSWSQGTGSAEAGTSGAPDSYNVYCDVRGTSPITKKCATANGSGSTSTRVGGLTNGTEYDLQVSAVTEGGNEGPRSNTVSGTPVQVDDFWRLYKNAGGHEEGGCAGGAAGLVAMLALVPLVLRRRRS